MNTDKTPHYSTVKRFSIDGWTIRYYEPTNGMRSFNVDTHKALADAKSWLDSGGYAYTVTVRR